MSDIGYVVLFRKSRASSRSESGSEWLSPVFGRGYCLDSFLIRLRAAGIQQDEAVFRSAKPRSFYVYQSLEE